MNVLAILNSPWAILPERYVEIREIYLNWKAGNRADISAIEARLGRPLDNVRIPYTIENRGADGRGTAVIPIQGVISKRMNLFSEISGGTSTQLLGMDFRQALADPEAHSLMFEVDSPGGQVEGVHELARSIRAARGIKPMATLADSTMASAAYWIGAAADPGQIFAIGETTQVGSIGVVAKHLDISKADEMKGIKVSLITSGGEKGLINEHVPLTPESAAILKETVEQIYGVFVGDVAASRGVSAEEVLDRMAGGKIFIGSRAQTAGLIDGLATREQVLSGLARRADQMNQNRALSLAAAARLEELQLSI